MIVNIISPEKPVSGFQVEINLKIPISGSNISYIILHAQCSATISLHSRKYNLL